MATSFEYSFKAVGVDSDTVSITALSASPMLRYAFTGLAGVLGSGTTPAVTKVWGEDGALSAGAKTIDLTALARGAISNHTFSGLKIHFGLVAADSTNTQDLTIAEGATNGYALFGSSGGPVKLGAGGVMAIYNPEYLQDVGASDLSIDLSSSDVDAGYRIILAAG